jgi:hypothetical protein
VAAAAVSALALHRYDPQLQERTADAVKKRGGPALWAHFKERFHLPKETAP